MTKRCVYLVAAICALGLTGFSQLVFLRPTGEAERSNFNGGFFNNRFYVEFGKGKYCEVRDLNSLRDIGRDTLLCSKGRSALVELAPGSELPSSSLFFGSNGRGNGRVRYEEEWYAFQWP